MQVKRAASFEDGAFPHCLDGGGLRCAGRRFRNADAHVSWPRKRSASRLAFQPSFYLVLPGFHVFDVAAFQYAILFSFCYRVSSFFHFISFGLRSIRLLTKFYLVLPSFTGFRWLGYGWISISNTGFLPSFMVILIPLYLVFA